MAIRLYFYKDDNGNVYEMFDRDNITHDAVMINLDGKSFWQVKILPNKPTECAKIIAQRETMEEAIEVLKELSAESSKRNFI